MFGGVFSTHVTTSRLREFIAILGFSLTKGKQLGGM